MISDEKKVVGDGKERMPRTRNFCLVNLRRREGRNVLVERWTRVCDVPSCRK